MHSFLTVLGCVHINSWKQVPGNQHLTRRSYNHMLRHVCGIYNLLTTPETIAVSE